MLFRARTTLADRPGSLAELAQRCGEHGVNILGLQIFPGLGGVTDEIVLRAPQGWDPARVTELVEQAGGKAVSVGPCSEHTLVDGPTRYLHAIRRVLDDPAQVHETLSELLDAEPAGAEPPTVQEDELRVAVAGSQLRVRRAAPFTATEHARAAAFGDLAGELVGLLGATAAPTVAGASLEPVVEVTSAMSLHARSGRELVAQAMLMPHDDETLLLDLTIDPRWVHRGVGTKILVDAARLARARGADEVLVRVPAVDDTVLPLVFSAGLRGRVRQVGGTLNIRIGVSYLSPLPEAVPGQLV